MWWYIIQPEKEGNTATCCNMDGYDAQERKQTWRPHAVKFHGGAVSSRAKPRQKKEFREDNDVDSKLLALT